MGRGAERFINRIVFLVDATAAILLAIITLLTFVTVVMRYVLGISLPGAFDVSRLLLGVGIFWGIAAAAWRNEHIHVDLFWQILPPRARRVLDLFGDFVFIIFAAGLAWMLFWQVDRVRISRQTTFELSIPIWPFHAIAWLGIALCVLVLAGRLLRTMLTFNSTTAEAGE